MPSRGKSTAHRRMNKAIRQLPGGDEVLDGLAAVEDMLRALRKRADDGDQRAAEKVSVAEVGRDRLDDVRDALAEHIQKTHGSPGNFLRSLN